MSLVRVKPMHIPELDPECVPASLWNREYRRAVAESGGGVPVVIALVRPDGGVARHETAILEYDSLMEGPAPAGPRTTGTSSLQKCPRTTGTSSLPDGDKLNNRYIERLIKFLLWQKGSSKVLISDKSAVDHISSVYSKRGARSFDYEFMGQKIYGEEMSVEYCPLDKMPETNESTKPLGGHLDGCRIGFDLGGSDRKCAAVVDGEVVYSEEVKWNPYFEKDPQYHIDGINDSIQRAADKMPRVDAIGGSAAGIYINNEVCVGSLYRGISEADFDKSIRSLFMDLQKKWGVPFEVVNDGEVTALAGSMSIKKNAVLGVSMGTSVASGYVTPEGKITSWLNELAFVPVDYRAGAPVDEWSGDAGCAVQYFCQQGAARLAAKAGIVYPDDMPLAERLADMQALVARGDEGAMKVFETIGTCFGYAIAHFADFYEFSNLLLLGRVTTGDGGAIIVRHAEEVLKDEFPELKEKIRITMPDEKMKRHGQAVAAASLPEIDG